MQTKRKLIQTFGITTTRWVGALQKNGFTQNYNFSIDLQHLNVHNGHTQIAFHSSPSLNYEKGKWRATVRPELDLEYLTQQRNGTFRCLPRYMQTIIRVAVQKQTHCFITHNLFADCLILHLIATESTIAHGQISPTFMPRTQSLNSIWTTVINFNLNHSYKRVVKEFLL